MAKLGVFLVADTAMGQIEAPVYNVPLDGTEVRFTVPDTAKYGTVFALRLEVRQGVHVLSMRNIPVPYIPPGGTLHITTDIKVV